jgi:RND superfamily putative drug exporter
MAINLSTESLARASARRPWVTVGIWVGVVIIALVLVALLLSSALTTEATFTNKPESMRALDLLEDGGLGSLEENAPPEIAIVQSEKYKVDDPEFKAFVEGLVAKVGALGQDKVELVPNYYVTGADEFVSEDRHTTLVPFKPTGEDIDERADNFTPALAAVREYDQNLDFRLIVTGEMAFNEEFQKIAEKDLNVEFKIGIPAAIVILVLVFGALLAATVPVVLALVSILVALGLTALVGQAWQLSFFVTNMIAMMGLAVGVDYSLFVVSRFREERGKGRERTDAIAIAGATASRAVLFSGMTVVLALFGLLIVPLSIPRSLAAGAIIVVIVSVLASLTLLPAILGLMGDKVNALRIPFVGRRASDQGKGGGFWDWASRAVMKQPVLSLIVVVGLLVAVGVPAFGIETGQNGVSTFPDGLESKEGFEILNREFSYGLATSPASIVVVGDVNSPQVQAGIERLKDRLAGDEYFTYSATRFSDTGDLADIQARVNGDPNAEDVVAAVRRLRDEHVPAAFGGVNAEMLVTGVVAANIDYFDTTSGYMPIVFVFVLALSFILLTVVFRSLVVPIKAILMNLLSIGATYGLLVLVFQYGFAADLFGFTQVDVIDAWVPLFLFSVLFGLSMDYHVFLISRIRENFDRTQNNTESVAMGIRSTAGLITGAALIMVAVFSGFAAGDLVMFQQFGFGMAVAVLLDATIIRSVLVPASMKLLGKANWYLPRLLNWLPELRVEAERTQPEPAQSD